MALRTVRLKGHIDERHRLIADAPVDLPPDPVEIAVIIADGGTAGSDEIGADDWLRGVAREWSEDLGDPRQDIYTLSDGEPVNDDR